MMKFWKIREGRGHIHLEGLVFFTEKACDLPHCLVWPSKIWNAYIHQRELRKWFSYWKQALLFPQYQAWPASHI